MQQLTRDHEYLHVGNRRQHLRDRQIGCHDRHWEDGMIAKCLGEGAYGCPGVEEIGPVRLHESKSRHRDFRLRLRGSALPLPK